MANPFDREMERLRAEENAGSFETKAETLKELSILKRHIESSRAAASVDLDVQLANDSLAMLPKARRKFRQFMAPSPEWPPR